MVHPRPNAIAALKKKTGQGPAEAAALLQPVVAVASLSEQPIIAVNGSIDVMGAIAAAGDLLTVIKSFGPLAAGESLEVAAVILDSLPQELAVSIVAEVIALAERVERLPIQMVGL